MLWLPLVTLAVASPGPVANHRMVYDPVGRRILVYVGVQSGTAQSPYRSVLWALTGDVWQSVSEGGPAGREDAQLVYDTRRSRVVLYGGRQLGPNRTARVLTDTWEWDGRSWQLRDSIGPGPRTHPGMAYDSARGVSVIFGGFAPNDSIHADTWEWDGAQWTRRSVSGPTHRWVNGLVYHSGESAVLLHAAILDSVDQNNGVAPGELWKWNGAAWALLDRAPPLSPQQQPVVADFGLVYFYGWQNGQPPVTWIWNQHRWRRAEGIAPPARRSTDLVFDPIRRVVVLIGGENGKESFADRWEFDGRAWTSR